MLAAIVLVGLLWGLPQAPAATAPPAGLAAVKRIYVEPLGKGAEAQAIQAMVISALVQSKRFAVTENRDRADAVLQGSAVERTSREVHAYGSSTAAGALSGAASVATGRAAVVGKAAGIGDSSLDTETDAHASVSVRLVAKDGDILWSTTQESDGGKYEGAGASAADACVKQLLQAAGPVPLPH